jgi:hypothetical protein
MDESANTSENPTLLTARSVILVVTAIVVISIIWGCFKMLRPADSSGLASDSYGTRAHGYRGLYELLKEVKVSVNRQIAPPNPNADWKGTIALLGPDPDLVLFEPTYLKALLAWVEAGGRLVVAPREVSGEWNNTRAQSSGRDVPGERNILKLLEVAGTVSLEQQPATDTVAKERSESAGYRHWNRSRTGNNSGPTPMDLWNGWSNHVATPRDLQVDATGSLAELAVDVKTVAAPGDEFTTLKVGDIKPAGTLSYTDVNGDEQVLAAAVSRGRGEIVVLSDPDLLNNLLIARNDNSVLAARLLSPSGQPVDFDEYYHGLAVRGNPMFLLTRPGFATVAVALLLVVGVVAWRSAVYLGPPLPDVEKSRRDILEYVNAMGSFFARGSGHRRFLVHEVRDGVLRHICDELHLPPHTTNAQAIVTALARRNPQRASALGSILRDVDTQLAAAGEYPKSVFLSSVQRLAGCL